MDSGEGRGSRQVNLRENPGLLWLFLVIGIVMMPVGYGLDNWKIMILGLVEALVALALVIRLRGMKARNIPGAGGLLDLLRNGEYFAGNAWREACRKHRSAFGSGRDGGRSLRGTLRWKYVRHFCYRHLVALLAVPVVGCMLLFMYCKYVTHVGEDLRFLHSWEFLLTCGVIIVACLGLSLLIPLIRSSGILSRWLELHPEQKSAVDRMESSFSTGRLYQFRGGFVSLGSSWICAFDGTGFFAAERREIAVAELKVFHLMLYDKGVLIREEFVFAVEIRVAFQSGEESVNVMLDQFQAVMLLEDLGLAGSLTAGVTVTDEKADLTCPRLPYVSKMVV